MSETRTYDTILGRVEWPKPTVTTWPWPTQQAAKQVCPVCKGKTTVPPHFYPDERTTNHGRVKCRSCGGRGIV